MYHDCEKQTGPRWSPPNDPRITPFGRVLRKLHLDELPQLWNVLKGDMSLIGPRPERPEIVARLRESVPGYDRRHAVKPGITGYAQIHLPPDTCLRSVKNKLVYDLFYIRHRSPWMELVHHPRDRAEAVRDEEALPAQAANSDGVSDSPRRTHKDAERRLNWARVFVCVLFVL